MGKPVRQSRSQRENQPNHSGHANSVHIPISHPPLFKLTAEDYKKRAEERKRVREENVEAIRNLFKKIENSGEEMAKIVDQIEARQSLSPK